MKVIVAGTRHFVGGMWYDTVRQAIEGSGFVIREIVSGNCAGVDQFGERFANQHDVKCRVFPADWDQWGKLAGPKRNKDMAEYADALVLIWDGKSRGSASMKSEAQARGLPIFEVLYDSITATMKVVL